MGSRNVTIGSRGSPLALWQANWIKDLLQAHHSDLDVDIKIIKTSGDKIQNIPLAKIGGKGLFVKEIEDRLLDGSIDIAVHSMKDMPTMQPDGLILDTYLPREDFRDAFISNTVNTITDLPKGCTVGTSSLRRRAQVLNIRRDLEVVEFRGNVQTRLKKLTDGVASGTFLAMAGLNRLDIANIATKAIEPSLMLPAVGQGAIGIERRASDRVAAQFLEPIHHVETGQRLAAERAFLKELDGSCETPIAGLSILNGTELFLRGEVLKPDGTEKLVGKRRGVISDAVEMGHDLARELLSQAGAEFFTWR